MVIMKRFIFSFLLPLSFFSFFPARANLPDDSVLKPDNSELSVWKIYASEYEDFVTGKAQGTGVFIGKKHLITSFKVISSILNQATDRTNIVLLQEGDDLVLKVKEVVTLSALCDLALLKIEEEVTNFVRLRETPIEPREDLSLIAQPYGILSKFSKIGDIIYQDDKSYIFPVDDSLLSEVSGPVLDKNRQVVGLSSRANDNLLTVIKPNHLADLILGLIGTDCMHGWSWPSIEICIKEEIRNLKRLAEKIPVMLNMNWPLCTMKARELNETFKRLFIGLTNRQTGSCSCSI